MKLFRHEICRKLLPLLFGFAAAMGALMLLGTFSVCNGLYADTLRLHIRAASDEPADQAVKLLVRDRLVAFTAGLTEGAEDAQEAAALMQAHLPELQAEAETVLAEHHCPDPVSVEIRPQYFNTRRYDTAAGKITLPAGEYKALVVTIGEGQGHNWWCVLYPSLCLPAAEGETEKALARYTDEERRLVAGDYEIRFWLAEMWTRLAAWIEGETVRER